MSYCLATTHWIDMLDSSLEQKIVFLHIRIKQIVSGEMKKSDAKVFKLEESNTNRDNSHSILQKRDDPNWCNKLLSKMKSLKVFKKKIVHPLKNQSS